jgi:hypothetical protein
VLRLLVSACPEWNTEVHFDGDTRMRVAHASKPELRLWAEGGDVDGGEALWSMLLEMRRRFAELGNRPRSCDEQREWYALADGLISPAHDASGAMVVRSYLWWRAKAQSS